MANPYESPNFDADPPSNGRRRSRSSYVIGGAIVGALLLVTLAQFERLEFYALRSFLTGESDVAEIVSHPADVWILTVLFVAVVFGCALVGFFVAPRQLLSE
jgi:hypothetical protein